MKTRIKVWGLQLRIWLVEKLGGESEDLNYDLWSLTRPLRGEPIGPFASIIPDLYRAELVSQLSSNSSLVNALRLLGQPMEWSEDVQMPRIVTSMAPLSEGSQEEENPRK